MLKKEVISLCKVLSDATRFEIVEVLLDGERCACEIPLLIGKNQSTTSMQLQKLVYEGILESRKQGRNVIYKMKNQCLCNLFKSINYSSSMKSCQKTFPKKVKR